MHSVFFLFANYLAVIEKHKFKAARIWNMDETSITTVLEYP